MRPPQPTPPRPLPEPSADPGDAPAFPTGPALYEQPIFAAYERLRTICRIAGLRLVLSAPAGTDQSDHVLLVEVDEATMDALVGIIAGPADIPHEAGVEGAATRLLSAARAAQLDLRPGAARDGWLSLGFTDEATVTRLADLVDASLTALFDATEQLRAALTAHGIEAGKLTAEEGAVGLREITVSEGDRLLQLLTGELDHPATDPDDQHACERLVSRLTSAVKTVTGGFIDVVYTPYCRRCAGEPALFLDALPLLFAQRLTTHLKGIPA